METDGYRRQKAEKQAEPEYLDFTQEDAAAARQAAAREAAKQRYEALPGMPAQGQVIKAIQAIQQQVDGLEKEVRFIVIFVANVCLHPSVMPLPMHASMVHSKGLLLHEYSSAVKNQ
jgi:hypothetical protein